MCLLGVHAIHSLRLQARVCVSCACVRWSSRLVVVRRLFCLRFVRWVGRSVCYKLLGVICREGQQWRVAWSLFCEGLSSSSVMPRFELFVLCVVGVDQQQERLLLVSPLFDSARGRQAGSSCHEEEEQESASSMTDGQVVWLAGSVCALLLQHRASRVGHRLGHHLWFSFVLGQQRGQHMEQKRNC